MYPDFPPAVGFAVTAMLSVSGPQMIVLHDLDDPPRAAAYGEIMVASFHRFGAVGLVTNGGGRDIEQVRGRRFPCWTSSLIVAHGYSRIMDIQIPVTIGGLTIRPGDLLHADGNGIVSIPADIAAGVAKRCAPYMEAEQIILKSLENERLSPDGYQAAIDKFKQALETLKLRARELLGG